MDGKLIPKTVEMPFSLDSLMPHQLVLGAVNTIANREYYRGNFQTTCTYDVDLNDYPLLTIWSVITVTHPIYGWVNKPFRVMSMNQAVDSEQFNIATLSLSEYDDSIYQGQLHGETGTSIIPPQLIVPPSNLTLTTNSFLEDGTATLSWEPEHFTTSARYDVEYRLSSDKTAPYRRLYTSYARTDYVISRLRAETYDFRVRVHDYVLGLSVYTTIEDQDITPDGSYELPQVTGGASSAETEDFKFTWDDMTSAELLNVVDDPTDPSGKVSVVSDVFSHYEVEFYNNTTLLMTKTTGINSIAFEFADNISRHRSITAKVKIVDINNIVNVPSQINISVNNTQMDAPSNVTVENANGNSTVNWDAPEFVFDFRGTDIHVSVDPNFVPSAASLYSSLGVETQYIYNFPIGVGGIVDTTDRYVRIGHFDFFAKTGMVYSDAIKMETVGSARSAFGVGIISSSQVFVADDAAVLSPAAINFEVNRQNLTGNITWTTSPSLGAPVIGDTFTITAAQFGSNTAVQVFARTNEAVSGDEFSDVTTIHKLSFGTNAISAILSNEAHTIITDEDGLNQDYGGSGTTISVYDGTNKLQATNSVAAAGQFNVSVARGNGAATEGGSSVTGSDFVFGDITVLDTDVATLNFTLSGITFLGEAFSIVKVQSFSKGYTGATGQVGNDGAAGLSIVYKGELAAFPTNPEENWTFKLLSTGIVYIYSGGAWVYMTSDGDDGANGANGSAGLSVYITYHANSIYSNPATPTGDGTTGGWSTTSTFNMNWMSQKVSSGSTVGTWGTPIRITGADGATGATGQTGATGIQGDHGSGSVLSIGTGPATTATNQSLDVAYRAAAGLSGGATVPQGSMIAFVNNANPALATRRDDWYKSGSASNSWQIFANVVNGSQIIHGSLAAHHLAAQSVTTDKLQSNIVIGNSATFSGNLNAAT
ncbi:MAG: fibronectin type III domain-containing protein, partial [Epibacterium sp.]|nr:fibronectin type III domain-containing protein [Epibacterium sp.]NQX75438.1 fibronectin type III domain-containing protein [Epibacterium sp.]